ncbi:MAG: hypothetical protein JHC95_08160 [Solirubrobacteraceae bacterium]|nr:hypothetical protein [Solirubrobacteraceae bacterium]
MVAFFIGLAMLGYGVAWWMNDWLCETSCDGWQHSRIGLALLVGIPAIFTCGVLVELLFTAAKRDRARARGAGESQQCRAARVGVSSGGRDPSAR